MLFSCKSCPTLCDPMDCSPPDSSVHGILQARVLESVAISSSREHLLDTGIEPLSPALAGGLFTTEPSRKPNGHNIFIHIFSCPLRVNILFIQNEYIMKENQIDRIVCVLKIPPVVPWWPLPFALVYDLLFSSSTAFPISAHTSKTRGFYNPLVFSTEYTVYQGDLLYQYFCSQYVCLFHSRELDSVLMCSRDKIILSNCCVLKQSRGFTSQK